MVRYFYLSRSPGKKALEPTPYYRELIFSGDGIWKQNPEPGKDAPTY